MKNPLQKFNIIAVLFFIQIIILAHFLSVAGYDWKINTVSELAAQGYARKWLMQIGFMIFGLILFLGIVNKTKLNTINYPIDIPIGIYGLAIFTSGIFCTQPFLSGLAFSEFESNIHSISATIAGIAFSISILASGIQATKKSMRVIHFAFLVFVMGMSAYFGISESNNGLIQKMMYLGSFFWLVRFYE